MEKLSRFGGVVPFAPVIFLALASPLTAEATTIQYQVTDLNATTWEYEYFLNGGNLLEQQGFAVFFDSSLYSGLAVIGPNPQGWDPIVVEPIANPQVQAAGYYDALALVNLPPFTGPFRVSFTWLGPAATIPGSQPFEVYELDASGTPIPFETGQTIRADATTVPEPATLLLAVAGMGMRRVLRIGSSRRDRPLTPRR